MSASPLHPHSSTPRSSLKLSLLFPTLLFSLLLASALIHSIASFLNPIHDYLDIHRFSGRRFMSTGVLLISSTNHRNVDRFRGGDENLHCDRSHFRTDVCVAKGDVRVLPRSAESSNYRVIVKAQGGQKRQETLRPYTRKWEESVMKTIDSVVIQREVIDRMDMGTGMDKNDWPDICDVRHDVPAIVFSTGGYTGNVYHEFNDGLIPLFLTAGAYKGEVVLMVLEYHSWWITKYAEIISQITNHQVIDMANDPRVHCFPELQVGLHIHDELSIDPRSETRVSMADFQAMLHSAYLPRLQSRAAMSPVVTETNESQEGGISSSSWPHRDRPKLVIVSRKSPRAIVNQEEVASMARDLGFDVQILSPVPTTEMVDIYSALHTCDVMMGVHGAAMTHLLFMRPGTTFIQVVPLGTDWAAATYYGEPAMKLGLDYVQYNVSAFESSLSNVYPLHHPVLANPNLVNAKGWSETKRIYLEGQDLTLSLPKLRSTLLATRSRIIARSPPRSFFS